MAEYFDFPINIEKFAAYLDNNLSDVEMNEVESIISENSELQDFLSMSDNLDELIKAYTDDDFIKEADMAAFEDEDIEIPEISNEDNDNIESELHEDDFPINDKNETDFSETEIDTTSEDNGIHTDFETYNQDVTFSDINIDSSETDVDFLDL